MKRPIAISDSANVYVSAKRIFDPSLTYVPEIVLSNNDCAVARFDEAKALGIKMDEPLHLIQDKIKLHSVRVFSSNDTLYGDICRCVVEVYEDFTPNIEIHSIDGCFLDFSGFKTDRTMRHEWRRRIGVPVRVGIAPCLICRAQNRLTICDMSAAEYAVVARMTFSTTSLMSDFRERTNQNYCKQMPIVEHDYRGLLGIL